MKIDLYILVDLIKLFKNYLLLLYNIYLLSYFCCSVYVYYVSFFSCSYDLFFYLNVILYIV